MSTSKHSTLTQLSLVKFIEDVELEFTAAYDTAPPLPRPVPKGYKLIRLLCIIENAREAAPMKPLEELKTITERRVQRLATYYVRASELSHCHAQLAAKKTLTNKSLQLACLGATTAVSIILNSGAGLDPDLLLVLSGIVVTVVGGITSWTKYADYEDKAQRHTLASDAFAQLAAAIAAALALASDEAEAALKEKVAHLDRLTTLAQRVLKVGAVLGGAFARLKASAFASPPTLIPHHLSSASHALALASPPAQALKDGKVLKPGDIKVGDAVAKAKAQGKGKAEEAKAAAKAKAAEVKGKGAKKAKAAKGAALKKAEEMEAAAKAKAGGVGGEAVGEAEAALEGATQEVTHAAQEVTEAATEVAEAAPEAAESSVPSPRSAAGESALQQARRARSRGGGHVEPAKPPPPSPPTSPPALGDIEAVMPTRSRVTAPSSSDEEDEGTDETTPQTGEEANLALQACSACLPSDPRSQRSAPPPPPHLCTALFAHSSAAPVHLLLPCPAAAAAHGA